jgi:two-component system, OmpR family, phosphate regulon sensor histidine kinase PhoR
MRLFKINYYSPQQLSFITAFVIAVVVSLLYYLSVTYYLKSVIELNKIVLVFPIVFAVSFALVLWAFEKFLNKKIKLIYKTIHNLKITKDTEKKLDMGTDVLQEVTTDVVKWANESRNEIEKLKIQENYRRDFLGNVSHELKTPIFNIQGYILTLLEGGLEDANINRDYLMRAQRSVERMIHIVEDLDDITKLESGDLKLKMEKFNIVELCKETMNGLEMKAEKSKMKITFRKDYDSTKQVVADRMRVKQVLVNLIDNALKYGKENGVVEIRFYDMDENILIEIADDGLGIPEKHLSRLFERFYRVDSSRSRDKGGSGLGLAIVKHIIEAHGQTINVRSTEGKGSTFSFTLKMAN